MLHIQGLHKQYGSKILFHQADAHIGHRSRVALVGPNGAGKSTLIKMILGMESPDEGQITRANHLAIGYLPQDIPKMSGRTVLAETMRMDGRREELLKAKIELEELFQKEAEERDLERYGRVMEELEHLDEYRLESRAKAILMGMGFKLSDFDRSLTEFSGGWLMRVALSRILLLDPDLLLLDEPTNHLDLESLLWLEEFLKRASGAMLVISHDTGFLNRLVTEVLEVDQKSLWSYNGNLEAAKVQKDERLTLLRAQYESQQSKIADIEAFVDRFGAKATKARQAQSRLKQLEKMELIELPEEKSAVRFRFPPAPHSGKDVVTMKNAGVKFGERVLFRDLNWLLRKGTRTAIVGINGAGKTTLLKLLAQTLPATTGEVKLGHEVLVGYYSQMQTETLNMKNSVSQELESVAPDMPIAQVRAIAGAFLFSGDSVHKPCQVLSGGEKARVALAKLLLTPANFLILDEPTNHLDVDSREVLLKALQDFSGTLCLVSHDREFVAPLVDTILEIEPTPTGSEVIHSTQTYADYLERKMREASATLSGSELARSGGAAGQSAGAPAKADSAAGADSKKAPSNNQKIAWKKEFEKLEARIAVLEKKKAELDAQIADPATYGDKEKTHTVLNGQRDVGAELEASYTRWEELTGLLGLS